MGFIGHAIQGDFSPHYAIPLAVVTIIGGIAGGKFSLFHRRFQDATSIQPEAVRIQPFLPEGLASASAKLRTVHGEVVSRWNRAPDGFQLRVTLPANTVGVVSLPATTDRDMVITEGDSLVWKEGSFRPGTAGFSGAVRQKGRINFSIGSGSYVFRLQHGSGPGDNP